MASMYDLEQRIQELETIVSALHQIITAHDDAIRTLAGSTPNA